MQCDIIDKIVYQGGEAAIEIIGPIIEAVKGSYLHRRRWEFVYILSAAIVLTALLAGHHYTNSRLYVVIFDGQEIGLVEDPLEVEEFADHLLAGCAELYGIDVELDQEIILEEQVRLHGEPDSQLVKKLIREQARFLAPAYQFKVDGRIVAPVASADTLTEVEKSLTEILGTCSEGAVLVEAGIVEELDLEPCMVAPESLVSAEDVVAVLTASSEVPEDLDTGVFDGESWALQGGSYYSRHLDNRDDVQVLDSEEAAAAEMGNSYFIPANMGWAVRVRTVEELTVQEEIPFVIEYEFDKGRFNDEEEITRAGEKGLKEVIYQITRENGVEIERQVLSDIILQEPVNQIEVIGTRERRAPVSKSQFVWPVQGQGIIYPNQGFRPGHTGIDIHIDQGTNVLAADAGRVQFVGWGGTQGNYIIIHHGAYWTLYLHNSANLVREGERVSRGQVIGKVGATGRAIGAHLHFEVRVDDGSGKWHSYYQHEPIDPLQFFNYRR